MVSVQKNQPLKLLVTGSSGFIGSALCAYLSSKGYVVYRLIRGTPSTPFDVFWNPDKFLIDARKIDGIQAVIHLAGKSIADERWSPSVKQEILSSRVTGTSLLSKSLTLLTTPPKVFISASAIGYYGNCPHDSRGREGVDLDSGNKDEYITEEHAAGEGFLPEICQQWEASVFPAVNAGIRVVNTRIGMVLSSKGGALSKMLLPFRLGLGGRMGSGKQGMSWIMLDDLLAAMEYIILQQDLSGPVNLVSPNPVSNRDFTKILAKVLHRPAFFSLPAWTIKALLGEMGDALLLSGAWVIPEKLQKSGFGFSWPELEAALCHELGVPVKQRFSE